MDEVADNAAYAAVMRLAHDLNDDDDVSERLAVPLRPTPPPPAPAAAALAPPTTRVVNRHAPSANAAFVGISNRDADTPTVRLGTAAVTLAPRRGENVVRAQMAAVEARGEEETGLVRVREEERRAHFAAAPGAPGVANSRGRSHTKTLPPPALARLVVEQIGGERRVHLDHLAPRSASDGAPSNAASPLYASGVVFHLRASSKLGGGTLLLHKFADQSATIVAGLLAHGAKPQRVHLAFELCSAWRVALEDRAGLANAIGAVKGFGPDAAIVYCALSRATRSSEEELIAIVDAAAPAHVLVAFPTEDARMIGDDPDRLTQYLASAIATSAGHSIYAQSWWHGTDALLYDNLNGISDIPRDVEAQADVLSALLDQCTAPVVYVIARTSPGNAAKRAAQRRRDERRAIAAGTPLPPPDEDKSVTLQLATLRLAVDAATRKRGSAVRVVEVVLQDDGGASRGDLDDLNAVALMRRAKRGDHPGSGGSVVAGAVAGLEIELAPPSSGSEAPSDAIFLFTRADRLTRSVRLMREIATLASITTDPATGERLARVRVMTVEIESTSSLLAGDSVGPDAAVASTSRPDPAVASTSRPDPDPPLAPRPRRRRRAPVRRRADPRPSRARARDARRARAREIPRLGGDDASSPPVRPRRGQRRRVPHRDARGLLAHVRRFSPRLGARRRDARGVSVERRRRRGRRRRPRRFSRFRRRQGALRRDARGEGVRVARRD